MPFVLEAEGGRFGDHALALLSEIAEFGAQTGKLKAPESWSCSSPKAASAAYWVRKWKQEVSGYGFRSPCLTLSFAIRVVIRHLVPLCMGPIN